MHNAALRAIDRQNGRQSAAYALLSASWFCALGALGVFFPYFSLFLRENAGPSSTHVGMVLAISPLLGIVAQPAWGPPADRTGARASPCSSSSASGRASAMPRWRGPWGCGRSSPRR
jgi:MFS family permease